MCAGEMSSSRYRVSGVCGGEETCVEGFGTKQKWMGR